MNMIDEITKMLKREPQYHIVCRPENYDAVHAAVLAALDAEYMPLDVKVTKSDFIEEGTMIILQPPLPPVTLELKPIITSFSDLLGEPPSAWVEKP